MYLSRSYKGQGKHFKNVRIAINPYESYVYRYCDILKCFHLILKDEKKNNPPECINFLESLTRKMCDYLVGVSILENRKSIESGIYQLITYCQGNMNTVYYNRIINNHKFMMSYKNEVLMNGQNFIDTSNCPITGQLPTANKQLQINDEINDEQN